MPKKDPPSSTFQSLMGSGGSVASGSVVWTPPILQKKLFSYNPMLRFQPKSSQDLIFSRYSYLSTYSREEEGQHNHALLMAIQLFSRTSMKKTLN